MQTEVFSGREDAFAATTLRRFGEELGIPTGEISDVLATDRYAAAVRDDHDQAMHLGVRGVPFAVLGQRLGMPGAVSAAQYGDAIEQAWEQMHG